MDRRIHFAGIDGDAPEGVVADGIGRMGAEGDAQQRVVPGLVVERQALARGQADVAAHRSLGRTERALVQALLGGGCPGRGEIEDREGDLGADAAMARHRRDGFGEEVHVGETGGAAGDHLGDGEPGAVGDEIGTEPARFGRPDVAFQPRLERQIVRQATQQRHCGMAVGIDQPWHQQVVGQVQGLAGLVAALGLGARQQREDAPVADHAGAVLVDRAAGHHGHHPGGGKRQIGGLRGLG